MDKELLELVKIDYQKKKEERTWVIGTLQELEDLKGCSDVKRYFELIKQDTFLNHQMCRKTEDDLKVEAYEKYSCLSYENNEIYFFYGMYNGSLDTDGSYFITMNGTLLIARYRNIENPNIEYWIPAEECEEFTTNHCIILPNANISNKEEEYNFLHRNFIKDVFDLGEEEAIKRVLHK